MLPLYCRYVTALERNKEEKITCSPKKVIAMTLYGNNPRYTYGAIRNAQMAPITFPGWTLRIYVDKRSNPIIPGAKAVSTMTRSTLQPNATRFMMYNSTVTTTAALLKTATPNAGDVTKSKYTVPFLVLNKLRTLGAHIVQVEFDKSKAEDCANSNPNSTFPIPSECVAQPLLWRHLALDDKEADVVLIRNADGRLTERDHALVQHWLEKENTTFMSASEIEQTASNLAIRRTNMNLTQTVRDFAHTKRLKTNKAVTEEQLYNELLSQIKDRTCYNGIHCQEKGCKLFPYKAEYKNELFGQRYNIYDAPLDKVTTSINAECYTKDARGL